MVFYSRLTIIIIIFYKRTDVKGVCVEITSLSAFVSAVCARVICSCKKPSFAILLFAHRWTILYEIAWPSSFVRETPGRVNDYN